MLHTPAWDHPALRRATGIIMERAPLFVAAEEWRNARVNLRKFQKRSPGYEEARAALDAAERKLDEAVVMSNLAMRQVGSGTPGGKMLRAVHDLFVRLEPGDLITAREIADTVGVHVRSVYRYLSLLKDAGFPVISEAGIGYSVRKMDHHIGRHAPRERE